MARMLTETYFCGVKGSLIFSGFVLIVTLVIGNAQLDEQPSTTTYQTLKNFTDEIHSNDSFPYQEDVNKSSLTTTPSPMSSPLSSPPPSSPNLLPKTPHQLALSLMSYLRTFSKSSPGSSWTSSEYISMSLSSSDFAFLSSVFSNSDSSTTVLNGEDVGNAEGCGIGLPGHSRLRRIVGGTHAERCMFPWMVYIERDPGKDDLCGGTLVSDRHIITAAHCYDKLETWPVLIIGEYDRDVDNPHQRKLITSSYSLDVHPKYRTFNYDYDIALITLSIPVQEEYYECIHPICLPAPDQFPQIGDVCTVAGWGSTSRTAKRPAVSSPKLMTTDIHILNESICQNKYRGRYSAQSQLCAGDLTGGTDSCVGDSGGPLMCSSTGANSTVQDQSTLYLMGVISSGASPCAQKDSPALYTNIHVVRDWLDTVISVMNDKRNRPVHH